MSSVFKIRIQITFATALYNKQEGAKKDRVKKGKKTRPVLEFVKPICKAGDTLVILHVHSLHIWGEDINSFGLYNGVHKFPNS